MVSRMEHVQRLMFALACLWVFGHHDVLAYDNAHALQGVTEGKAYFDVNIGEPKKLLTRLHLIRATFQQLTDVGINPQFVIGFRGKASNYTTTGEGYVLEEELPDKQRIGQEIRALAASGIRIEQCFIAAGFQGVDPADILPEIEVVENGYVSMIGYHARGFARIPMD